MKKKPIIPKSEKTATILEKIDSEFVESSARKITPRDVDRLVPRLPEVLQGFTDAGPLERQLREAKLIVSLIEDFSTGEYREVPYWTIAVISFAMIYVLKPVDIIPDILPVIGQLDDAIVVTLCVDMVRDDLERYGASLTASPSIASS